MRSRTLLACEVVTDVLHVWRIRGRAVPMTGRSSDVTAYIDGQPVDWQPTLRRLRDACYDNLPGYAEALRHGMPAYIRNGQVEVGFAKQKRYLSFYVLRQMVLDRHRSRLGRLDVGKGCIRYRSPDQINWSVVAEILTETSATEGEVC
jgi:uncharacterized protein YdhG (YjbR/CyaY superfamily)